MSYPVEDLRPIEIADSSHSAKSVQLGSRMERLRDDLSSLYPSKQPDSGLSRCPLGGDEGNRELLNRLVGSWLGAMIRTEVVKVRKTIAVACILVGIGCGLALAAQRLPDFAYTEPALVFNVIDGDTFDVRWPAHEYELRVRPASIGTPERGQCYYEEAKQYAEAVLLGHWVWLDRGDPYVLWSGERLLAKVWLDCARVASFGRIMVSQGYAKVLTEFPRGQQLGILGLEEEAKQAGRGLWAECP